MPKPRVVVLGASAGGVTAFQSLLSALPKEFPLPIVIVHHLPANSKIDSSLVYGSRSNLTINDPQDKQKLLPGNVYFAPPDYHLLIEPDLSVSFDVSEPENYSRPSIDVTFRSVADSLGAHAVGVLLTGANSDGAKGIADMQMRGAFTIIQDPADAEVPTMPGAAKSLSPQSQVAKLSDIPAMLMALAGGARE